MADTVLWHNPSCSKSRAAHALLTERGVVFDVVEYLESPPSADEIGRVLTLLGVGPRDLMRKKDARYAELGLADEALDDDALIAAMVANPRLIERPVVIRGERAAVGRPTENIAALLP